MAGCVTCSLSFDSLRDVRPFLPLGPSVWDTHGKVGDVFQRSYETHLEADPFGWVDLLLGSHLKNRTDSSL